jgi:hypothetical protein
MANWGSPPEETKFGLENKITNDGNWQSWHRCHDCQRLLALSWTLQRGSDSMMRGTP